MTRSERLNAIIATLAPVRHAHQASTGQWSPRPGDERAPRFQRNIGGAWVTEKALTPEDAAADPAHVRPLNRGAAPYEIVTLGTGARRVIVFGEDGGSYAGNGATVEDALQDLERKVFGPTGRPE